MLLFKCILAKFPIFLALKIFTVTSYLNLKVLDAWKVLAGKFLDSKAKISKIEDFTHYKHMGKELMLECRILSYYINPGFSFG